MRALFIIILLSFLIIPRSRAQDYYKTAFGVRLGSDIGLSAKHFLGRTSAIEGMFSYRWKGFLLTTLYEKENIAFSTPGLNWYIGGGLHFGFWSKHTSKAKWWDYEDHPDGYFIMGADVILGMEYTLPTIPLNIAIDWKPAINFLGYTGFWGDFFAISLRYAFIRF